MSRNLSFQDVEKKYHTARECILSNISSINNPIYPSHAAWIDIPTMARWLYGSSKEFLEDYKRTSARLAPRQEEQNCLINLWENELCLLLGTAQEAIRRKYSQCPEIMEALK